MFPAKYQYAQTYYVYFTLNVVVVPGAATSSQIFDQYNFNQQLIVTMKVSDYDPLISINLVNVSSANRVFLSFSNVTVLNATLTQLRNTQEQYYTYNVTGPYAPYKHKVKLVIINTTNMVFDMSLTDEYPNVNYSLTPKH